MNNKVHIKLGTRPIRIKINRGISFSSNNYGSKINSINYLPKTKCDTNHAQKMPLNTLIKLSNCICKIKIGVKIGTGFFIKIKANSISKPIHFLISNEHIIEQQYVNDKLELHVCSEKGKNYILFSRFIKCFPSPIDITAVFISEEALKIMNDIDFLDIDLSINNGRGYNQYVGENVFCLQHPHGAPTNIAMGKIIKIVNNFEFDHSVDTDLGSSGSPIILCSNNKVIGIHRGGEESLYINRGTFIFKLIEELAKKVYN